ncbi:MAG: alpha/beta hydrolase [Anaerolineae bacterium]|nr:alpha/beta hydrolase [Anaerolineae bacterium]
MPEPYQAQLAIGLSLISAEAMFENKLKSIHQPTLILFGEKDKVVPTGNAQLLAAAISKSHLAILPNAGHFFPFEVPEQATDTLTKFLNLEL